MDKHDILPTGAWTDHDERHHRFDEGLAAALAQFFVSGKNIDIVDLGCGPGRYVATLNESSPFVLAVGYDGNPNLEFADRAACMTCDLTLDPYLCIGKDWILLLEVGEHVPAEHEAAIWNHLSNAKIGVVMSWAPPGQGGHGHVNCREPAYIVDKMAELGFTEANPTFFRKRSSLPWFTSNLRVFLKAGYDEIAERLEEMA